MAQINADTLPMDTLPVDTIPREVAYGLILERDSVPKAATRPVSVADRTHLSDHSSKEAVIGMMSGEGSWIMVGLIALFVVICIRFRKNTRYFTAMLSDLTEVRVRHNIFDETVRETSFLILLNVMWSLCSGVVLYYLVDYTSGLVLIPELGNITVPPVVTTSAAGIGVCMGIMTVYSIVMTLGYTIVGRVFSDPVHTRLWVKGYASAQGLDTILMFPVALLFLSGTGWIYQLLIVAAIGYILTKIIFIYKGFRIFFTQTASWVLFLYYLCSLEIVPLILTYLTAWYLCR